MVNFAAPFIGTGARWSFAPRVDRTKIPAPVSATSPFNVAKVLGRPIPIVIGTGKVDGIPVVGGAVTTQVVSGYTQQQLTSLQNLGDFPPGTAWLNNDPFSRTVLIPQYGSQQSARLGYLLAYDPFGAGYKLVRVEINDTVVYDAEKGIGASATFRFDGGTQTTPDSITVSNFGADAGAWQNFAIIYLDGYQTTAAPTVKCTISNAATDGGGVHTIAWTGTPPVTYTQNSAGRQAAYDPTEDIIYQLLGTIEIPSLTQVWLAVLDTTTYTERYRIPLQGSDAYVSGFKWIYSIRGSNFVFVRYPGIDFVYDVVTGAVVSSHTESGENFDWKIGFPFGDTYLIVGFDFDGGIGIPCAKIDVAGNLSIIRVTGAVSGDLVYGRYTPGTVSFFICDSAGTVKESTFDGDAWTTATVYTSAGVPTGVWYDSQTGYLVVFETVSGAYYVRYVNPDTGATIDSITVTRAYFIATGTFATGRERYWPRPGFVLMTAGTGDPGNVYLLDIGAKSISTFASHTAIDTIDFTTGIFDQSKSEWIEAFGNTNWIVHQLPSVLPGLVDLDSFILTKLMSLAGYGPSELTFDGFAGLQGYGFVIDSDTNVRNAVQAVADIYGFTFADTGNGFYFKKAGQDASFALDAALTTGDLVFAGDAAIVTQDEAEIRSPARVELDYISRDQGYTSRPASFTMPAINNSITVQKYSTPLVLSDADAQKFVTDKFFELQARRRTHTFSLSGSVEFLPGDIVSVPSGSITYTVQIDTVAISRNMAADISASDFQTAVSTTITSVTNQGLDNPVPVTLATQYIHLDVPLYRYTDDLAGAGLRQYGVVASRGQSGWGGGVLYRGDTASNLSALLTQAPHNGIIGTCTTVLNGPVDPFATTDISTVTFRKTSGDSTLLVNHTEAEVMAGANNAFIGAAGRWEWIGYKTVVDNGDGSFTLSGLSRRGYRGTEVFAYDHQVGDQFVMIDASWLKSVQHPVADFQTSKYYKAIGLTQDPSTGTVVQKQIRGAAETPYACLNLAAAVGSPDGIDLTWNYRSRLTTGTNPANFGEETLSFEIDILATDGVTVKRTLTATTNSKHYAHADVLTDFGSDPPSELFFNVYMMSAVVGRGYRARGHKYFSGTGSPIGLLLALTKA
ncbi:hypothetical protein EN788_22180 [Mesorhizobium sp. M2D.F.Ca.ET.145.01.1.1]|uniref:phage tail protein n=2 Tax=Mesorhizobium TaxID=68287 RepID=UPI000FC9E6A3|nr:MULTISPECIES: phage tail protein [unclassified Mesorhizobium]TGU44627.1 hypothetical protein EN789_21730 [bacterium M00.F.Ca.ET.146.01.1.1]TGU58455.1 hypothetical protein EN791_021730 [Mesorhizobium sp. M2D.F.Ca.ET.148.01.1.1]TGU64387.1 hypothetical protein EN790_21725 [Mesorhizobium sp. M2D.F.Ca.ET.147.01.1.1]TGW09963.1 hypothetical protein EN788_22180 [Mesorhizobium sp. M2D.F.Ca.ET.145.01.1.1]